MRRSGNRVLIIVLIVIALLAVAGGVFAYVYLGTDILRSGQELFAKYLTQNVEEITKTVTLEKIDEIGEKSKQNKYEENITISYTEAGRTEASGVATIEIQNDPINKKIYGMLSLTTQDPEETLALEYMKENNMYSLRFTNAVKQFLSVENSDLKQLATNLGMDEEIVELIPDTIDFEKFSLEKLKFTEEEKNAEISKYAKLLYSTVANEKYAKNKDTVITLNGKTITTNAYTLTLNEQDLKAIGIRLLETLKEDEIVLNKLQLIDEMIQEYTEESVKESFQEMIQKILDAQNEESSSNEEASEGENIVITVYEEKGKTVRIKVEQGLEYITIDTTEAENQKQIDINYTNIDEDNTQLSNKLTFIKESDNKLYVEFGNIEGEEQQTVELSAELVESENNTKLDIVLEDEDGKTSFSRNINWVNEINYKVTLDNSNNVVLNELTSEKISTIFTLVGDKLNTEYAEQFQEEHIAPFKIVVEPIATIVMYGYKSDSLDSIPESSLQETEKQAFNAKFQSYEGNSVSAAYVNALLNTVLSHNLQESSAGTRRYVTVSGDVILAADDTSIIRVEGATYYTVECEMDGNGLINNIIIEKTSQISISPEDITSLNDTSNTGEDALSGINSLN